MNECNHWSSKRQNKTWQKIFKHALPSNSSTNSQPILIMVTILWAIIVILFQFIHDSLTVIVNQFWNVNNKDDTTSHQKYLTASDIDLKISEAKRNKMLQMKQWLNASRMDDVWIYSNDFSAVDSGIDSRLISRANTSETLSEYMEGSGITRTSFRHCTKKWCDRSNYDQEAPSSGASHVSRQLTRTCHNSVTSSHLPTDRQKLSITRHVVRVRSAHSKRAKSITSVMRHRKMECEMGSYPNNSIFHDGFNHFY